MTKTVPTNKKKFKSTKLGNFIWRTRFLLKQRPYRSAHLQILLEDCRCVFRNKHLPEDVPALCANAQHLKEAMEWLKRAQDITDDGGVAAAYHLSKGWESSYPETTGYIIPTFFNYHHFSSDEEYRDRALRMTDWLLSIQKEDGAYQGRPVEYSDRPCIFNTGQIMLGLLRTHEETGGEKYLDAAKRAGDWLVRAQDQDGAWRKFAYNDIPHSYHTRVAWPLLKLFKLTGIESYQKAAKANLLWALGNQKSDGWFDENAFDRQSHTFTHTIVYAARGMLESGLLLDDPKYIQSSEKVAQALLFILSQKNFLPGDFYDGWNTTSAYSCLTGNAQLAILLMRLYQEKKGENYLNVAMQLNQFLRTTQNLDSRHPWKRGGIKGSHPIWGDYMSYAYPNWAVKFFADALLMEECIKNKRREQKMSSDRTSQEVGLHA